MALIEKQSQHRINLEATVIPQQLKQSSRGQIFGFVTAVLTLIIGLVFLFCGYPHWGGTIVTVSALCFAIVFVTGKAQVKASLEQKRPQDLSNKTIGANSEKPKQQIEKK